MTKTLPLALYIHFPWCVKKCPYCDFNSHALTGTLPEQDYMAALLEDFRQDVQQFGLQGREIHSVFMGGGTPSLMSPEAIYQLLTAVAQEIPFAAHAEITLEANPGTVEQSRFLGYRAAGINRLSIGVQSFQPDKLKALGRIHDDRQAQTAIHSAQQVGFNHINVDLMYALPQQTVQDALFDLQQAVSFGATHISWYQLTLEPHTAFYQRPPPLPDEETAWEIQTTGQCFLQEQGFLPYEISAYTRQFPSAHNVNYWLFGDYLGIGAGAHGKLTTISDTGDVTIHRRWKTKHPKNYLNPTTPFIAGQRAMAPSELPLEFMMNALRLYQPIPWSLFRERCGLEPAVIKPQLEMAAAKGLLQYDEHTLQTTALGKCYLNDLLAIFIGAVEPPSSEVER